VLWDGEDKAVLGWGENTPSCIWLGVGGFPTAPRAGASFPSLAFMALFFCRRGQEAEPSCTASLGARAAPLMAPQRALSTVGRCFLDYGSSLMEHLVAPTHAENWLGLLKHPVPYCVAPTQCTLPCWARSFTPWQCPAGEEGLAHPPAEHILPTEASPSPLAFSDHRWEVIQIKKTFLHFLLVLLAAGPTSRCCPAARELTGAWRWMWKSMAQQKGRQDLWTAAPYFLQFRVVAIQQPHSPHKPQWGRELHQWGRCKACRYIRLPPRYRFPIPIELHYGQVKTKCR